MEVAASLFCFSTVMSAVLGYLLLRAIHQIIHYRFFHPLSKFPGPFWASVTRLWIVYHDIRGQEAVVCEALHRRYGPIIRITPTMLLISDSTKLPLVFHRSADKTQHYITGALGPTEAMFNMRKHDMHARHRKIAAGLYSFTSIKKMEPLIDNQISYWLSQLDTRFAPGPSQKNGQPFDLCPWSIYMAYDVVSEIGFGAPFGFITQARDVGGLIGSISIGMVPFGIMARLHPFTEWLKSTRLGRKYLVATPEDRNGFGAMMRFRDALITKRLNDLDEGKNARFDLLQTFIDARDADGQPLPLDYIKAEVLIVLIAGGDTTGTSFQAFAKFILTNRPVYEKMMTEIDAATKANKLSSPVPQYEEVLEHCPYYVACIREAMRLVPAVPSIHPRFVQKGGVTLDGKYVPEGVELAANPYLMHRDVNIYGHDAHVFRPERWLESEEKTREYNKYNFAFGYGTRICLGKNIALMELYKAPLLFFRTFNVNLCNPETPVKYQVKGGLAIFQDMWISIERRVVN